MLNCQKKCALTANSKALNNRKHRTVIHRKRKTYQINLMIILGFKLEAFSEYWHRERKNTMVSLNLRRQKWELRETEAD